MAKSTKEHLPATGWRLLYQNFLQTGCDRSSEKAEAGESPLKASISYTVSTKPAWATVLEAVSKTQSKRPSADMMCEFHPSDEIPGKLGTKREKGHGESVTETSLAMVAD